MKRQFGNEVLDRRDFLTRASMGAAAVSLAGISPLTRAASPGKKDFPKGKAEHCIFLWLGGGMAQIDTSLRSNEGERKWFVCTSTP